MRTNIVLDDDLVRRAFKLARVRTKKDLIDLALREFVAKQSRKSLSELKKKVRIRDDYDYKQLRRGRRQ